MKKLLFIILLGLISILSLTSCWQRRKNDPEPLPDQPYYGSKYGMINFYKPNGTDIDDIYEVYNGKNDSFLYSEKWHYLSEDTFFLETMYSIIEKTRDFESQPYERQYFSFYLSSDMEYYEKMGRYNMEILNTKKMETIKDSTFQYKQVPGRFWKWYGYYTPFTTITAKGKFYDTVIHSEIDSMPYPYDPQNLPNVYYQKNKHLYFAYNDGLVRIDDVYLKKHMGAVSYKTDTISFTQWIKKP